MPFLWMAVSVELHFVWTQRFTNAMLLEKHQGKRLYCKNVFASEILDWGPIPSSALLEVSSFATYAPDSLTWSLSVY